MGPEPAPFSGAEGLVGRPLPARPGMTSQGVPSLSLAEVAACRRKPAFPVLCIRLSLFSVPVCGLPPRL